MTNDRRKTFNTPLEFWQWAIMEPGKRKARAQMGEVFYVHEFACSRAVGVFQIGQHFSPVFGGDSGFPLTAVEDEHGVIPEPEPELRHPKTTLGEVANWLEDIAVCKDEGDRLGASRQAAHFISKLMDERIAAAVFEVEIGNGQWMKRPDYRIKPSWKKS